MKKDDIKFIREKDFKFLKEIGEGALGKAVLIKDEDLNVEFVCKKYKPINGVAKEEYFRNFITEIKLLHLLYHKNIVRIFNYYLYSKYFTGYIVMEFIEGLEIDKYLEKYPENINNIFEQVIDGFMYLEENSILHRDIRPPNIMVDNKHNVKIIDFGFGKKKEILCDDKKSISLNWWGGEIPDDFKSNIYNIKTEIFFIGRLFNNIISSMDCSFKYQLILNSMIETKPINRIESFKDIFRKMREEQNNLIELFNYFERNTYLEFSKYFFNCLSSRESSSRIVMNINIIIKDLELLQKRTLLEEEINPTHIAKIFISGSYRYWKNKKMPVNVLNEFINLFKNSSIEKQNIILYNLETRFLDIEPYDDYDEIPF
ncbi:protein kinase [Arcobacter sp. CECT 9188]|uniref:protein kinase domain-containing protein n=1 Tax=Arcobacter sp. CECT 9188 TaxID=2044505 RepID=UPI000DE9B48B|nr:serine/threonine-protein kinase [Arcobacter sp. CECT 9188]RBQ27620.1 serine/threonine protein kinase [Arcobacter sp. CECT 9188]